MYVKLIDGRLQYAPKKVTINSSTVYNPTAEQLTALGYKPLTVEDAPVVQEGYHLEPVYTETAEAVVQGWTVVEDEPLEPTEGERIDMLEDALVELAEMIAEVMG